MPWWVDVLDVVGLLLAVVVLYGVALVVRRRLLARHGGTFELSHRLQRTADSASTRWVLGMGRYSGDELEWFRVFTLTPAPKRSWRRSELIYDQVRMADPGEREVLYPDHLVVTCSSLGAELDLAMSRGSLTGFQAWLESRTPGADWSQ